MTLEPLAANDGIAATAGVATADSVADEGASDKAVTDRAVTDGAVTDGAVADEVEARQQDLLAALRASAAAAGLGPDDDEAAALGDTIARLGRESVWAELRSGRLDRASNLLADLASAQSDVRTLLFDTQLEALSRIREELVALRAAGSPADILATAPRALCAACGFDRALISNVRGSTWYPMALHVAVDADSSVNRRLRDYLLDREIPLTSSMPEAELVRRKAPALVQRAKTDPRLFRPLMDVAGTSEYVVAPVQAGGSVLGFLHADNYASQRRLTAVDRDRLQSFADGLGLAVERAVAVERLGLQRDQVNAALSAVHAASEGLATAPVQLVREAVAPDNRSDPLASWQSPHAAVAPPNLPDGLTPRERDVLRLLASGATNAEIATRLTVSETTVKSHVKHILRKLRASNRAEAIARYLYLARSQARGL